MIISDVVSFFSSNLFFPHFLPRSLSLSLSDHVFQLWCLLWVAFRQIPPYTTLYHKHLFPAALIMTKLTIAITEPSPILILLAFVLVICKLCHCQDTCDDFCTQVETQEHTQKYVRLAVGFDKDPGHGLVWTGYKLCPARFSQPGS